MVELQEIVLQRAERSDHPVLQNLTELYVHDLSEAFSIEIGADGRFGYDRLPLYWEEPEKRFAYLIRADSRLAGFALVTRGSPLTDDPTDFDVAEFFVLRGHRRSGVGRRATMLLWDRTPGRWVVRVLEGNRGALAFWRTAVASYAGPESSERCVTLASGAWRVIEFRSPAQHR